MQPRTGEDGFAERRIVEPCGRRDLRQERGRRHARQGVDLEDVLVLAFGHQQVDPTRAGARESARRSLGKVHHAAKARGRHSRRTDVVGHPSGVLRAVVVEAVRRPDLDRTEDAAVENPDVHLGRSNEALDEHVLVERQRAFDRFGEFGEILGLAQTERRTLTPGLHDRRKPEAAVELLEVVQIRPPRDVVGRRRHVVETEHLLCLELVHRERAREDPAPGVREAHQLEEPLNAAVLAAAPVKRKEDHLDLGGAEQLVEAHPVVGPHDARDVMAAALERGGDSLARVKGYVALRAPSPHQDSHAPCLHWDDSELHKYVNSRINRRAYSVRRSLRGFPRGFEPREGALACPWSHAREASLHPPIG